MIFLFKFLYHNLKGYRFLVILVMLVTVAQVGSDLLAAMPLKFIPSKVNNPGSDPTCTFPFLDGVLSVFDTPILDPSLRPTQPNQPPGQPPPAPCPATPSNPNTVLHPRITQHSVIGVIAFSLIMLAVFGLLSASLVYIELFLAAFIAQHLSAHLREQLFDHLQRLSLDWHDKQKKGDLVQRVTGNIADIEKLVNDGIVDLLAGILTLVGVSIVMFLISQSYTLLALTIAPALLVLVLGYTSGIKAAARKKAKAAGKIADVATEDMNALTVIRAYTLEQRENRRFRQHVVTHRSAGMRAGRLQAQFTPLVSILVVFGTMIVVGIGGYVAAGNSFSFSFVTISASTIDIGTLILFLTYLKMLYQPMRDLSKLTTLASNGASGAERIQEVLDQTPEVFESPDPYNGPEKLQGEITFDNVIFGYTKERDVLKGINLHIPAGRKVALVGYSGSGKTTLVKLIPRFYELELGSIKIDGRDISSYPLHFLRQNISVVLQDSILFEGSVRENIEISKPGASLEEIIDACIKANIHETIMHLPDAYDTNVREQGNNFSAGQKQRLAIARAILRDAPILILDEPTANLDVEAEAEVMHAINTLIQGRTVITISHRLSTLGNVDEILVMHQGQIVEQGTFRELKHQEGVFTRLLKEQNRYNMDRDDIDVAIVQTVSRSTSLHLPAITPATLPRSPALYSETSSPIATRVYADDALKDANFTIADNDHTQDVPTVQVARYRNGHERWEEKEDGVRKPRFPRSNYSTLLCTLCGSKLPIAGRFCGCCGNALNASQESLHAKNTPRGNSTMSSIAVRGATPVSIQMGGMLQHVSPLNARKHKILNRKGIVTWGIIWLCLAGLLASLLVRIVVQFTHPTITPRLVMEQDIPLPGAFPDGYRTQQNPFAPGLAILFDHFDFMGLDTQTHLLFIAHSGPAPDREQQVNPNFNPDTDAKYDGNIVILNTVQKKIVGLLNIPQVAGVVVAPDLHKVYAADVNDNIIYAIDERTFKYWPIHLQDNDSPDGITYDPTDHLIFVSNPGAPPTPDSNIIDRKNQNETIIDALTDKVVARIMLGVDGRWGDDVGHVKFDPGLHRAFVVVQQLPDLNDPNPNLLPPPGTAWLVEINPITRHIITRLNLPYDCLTPHGMAIDTEQHIAFIACVDEDPASLIRVDLRTMRTISEPPWPVALKPDIIVLDYPLHLVYVACGTGISIFQEYGGSLRWLATYNFGTSTHTLMVNEQTQEIYLPLVREGNRPVLRIMHYNPNGT